MTSSPVTLTNVIIADDRVCNSVCGFVYGPGVYLEYANAYMSHVTVVRNTGGDGAGVHATYSPTWPDGRYDSMAYITNSIVSSNTVGVRNEKSKVWLESTLWGTGTWRNGANTSGSGTSTRNHDYDGDPPYVDGFKGDYHLAAGSPAIDKGLSTGVMTDFDNQPRPIPNTGIPDLGANEYWACQEIGAIGVVGPQSGSMNAPIAFGAVITPSAPTPNVGYVWTPEPETGQGTANAIFRFARFGEYTVGVTAVNCGGAVFASRVVTIGPRRIFPPLALKN